MEGVKFDYGAGVGAWRCRIKLQFWKVDLS
jgi:hypothetical protein